MTSSVQQFVLAMRGDAMLVDVDDVSLVEQACVTSQDCVAELDHVLARASVQLDDALQGR